MQQGRLKPSEKGLATRVIQILRTLQSGLRCAAVFIVLPAIAEFLEREMACEGAAGQRNPQCGPDQVY